MTFPWGAAYHYFNSLKSKKSFSCVVQVTKNQQINCSFKSVKLQWSTC